MSNGQLGDEGDNPVDNPNIFNVEGEDRLSPGLQPLTTVRFRNCILLYAENYFVVFYKTKH